MAADLSADLELIFQRVVKEKRALPDLRQTTTGTAAKPTAASPSPAKQHHAVVASPHNKICTFCREEKEHRTMHAMDRLVRSEALQRQQIADEESRVSIGFRDDHTRLKFSSVRDAITTQESEPRRIVGADVIFIAEQLGRRAIDESQTAEFDDTGASFRLTLRQAAQRFEVAERTKKRVAQDQSERKAKEQSAASSKNEQLVARQRVAVEEEETRARVLLYEIESTVAARMTEVAFTTRRDIRQHEARVEAMMQKHAQRLEMIDAELARVIFEESAARERHCAAERKAFEGTVCMEPDLKKRAAVHTKQRQAKEAREKQQLLDEEAAARQATVREESEARAVFDELCAEDAVAATHREARRHVRNKRRAWREKLEAKAYDDMLAHENAAWLALQTQLQREAFANPVPFDEASDRATLRQQFELEYAWVDDLLLERELTFAQFLRRTSEAESSWRAAVMSADVPPTLLLTFTEIDARQELEESETSARDVLQRYQSFWTAEAKLCTEHAAFHAMGQAAHQDFILTADNKAVLTTHVNAAPLDLGAIFRLLPPAGSDVLKELPGAFISVRILNPVPGDALRYRQMTPDAFGSTAAGSGVTMIVEDFEEGTRNPFSGVAFTCRNDSARPELLQTRVVSFTLCSVTVHAHIRVRPPHRVVVSEADLWTTLSLEQLLPQARAAASQPSSTPAALAALLPFRNLAFTPPSNLKSVTLGAYLSRGTSGRVVEFKLQPPFKTDGKGNVCKGSTVLCKAPHVTDVSFEAVVDKSHFEDALSCFASCVALYRGDSQPDDDACTVHVDCLLTDGTHYVFDDEIKWRYDAGSKPCLALPRALAMRSACRPQDPANVALCVLDPTFLFRGKVSLEFPSLDGATSGSAGMGRGRAIGGSIELELSPLSGSPASLEASAQPLVVMRVVASSELQAHGWEVDGNKLLWRDHAIDTRREVARVTGNQTSKLRIDFACHAKLRLCPTPAALRALVNHIAFYTTTPVAGALSEDVELTARCDIGVGAGVVTTRTLVRVNPSQLVGFSANPKLKDAATDLGLTYVEGAQPKPLPAFADISPPPGGFGLGARLRLEFVSGCEPGDDLSIVDAVMAYEGVYQIKSKNAVIGWWRQTAGENNHLLDIHLTADHGFVPTRVGEADDDGALDQSQSTSLNDVPIYAPYTAASLCESSNLSSAFVMLVLRAIRFRCDAGPKILKKIIRVTFDDGRVGRSCAVIHVKIDNIDEPTDILFESATVPFAPLSAAGSSNGVPIMSNVRLEDEDSDNFHEGFMSIELASPAPGDQIGLLDVPGQVASIFGGKLPVPSIAAVLHSHFDAETVPCVEPPSLFGLPLLLTLYQPPLLRQYGDRLFFRGESIGTITSKAAAANIEVADAPKVMHRIDFFAESRFVPFFVAEHVLRCFTFDNKSLRPKMSNRKIDIRLTPASTVTSETLTVTVSPPTLSPVALTAPITAAMNLTVTIDDPTKPKPLLTQAVATVGGDVLHCGHFHATILDALDKTEELLFDASNIKLKEKSVVVGKDIVGIMQHPRVALSDLYLIFSKVNSDTLTALAKGLSIKGATRPGIRRVVVRCSVTADDSHASQFTIKVVVPSKLHPPSVSCTAAPSPLSLGPENRFTRPLAGVGSSPGNGQHFLPGSQVLVSINSPCARGDLLALADNTPPSGGDVAPVSVKLNVRAAPLLDIYVGDLRVAKCPAACLAEAGKFIVGQSVSFTIVTEASPSMVQQMLQSVVFLTWNPSIRGTESRSLTVRVRERTQEAPPAGASPATLTLVPSPTNDLESATTVTFDMIPQLYSMSTKPVMVVLRSFDAAAVVLSPKLCISSAETDFVEVSVEVLGGAASESLSVDLIAQGDFLLDGQAIKSAAFTLVKEGARGKPRKTAIGTLITPANRKPTDSIIAGVTLVQARFSPITASTESAVVAWLESHRLSSTALSVPSSAVTVEVTVKTAYTACKCVAPIALKEAPSSAAASKTFSSLR